jgi:hypothetical protein
MYLTLEIPHQLPPKAFVFANREEALQHYDCLEAQDAIESGEYDDALEYAGRDLHRFVTFDSAADGSLFDVLEKIRGHQAFAAKSAALKATPPIFPSFRRPLP